MHEISKIFMLGLDYYIVSVLCVPSREVLYLPVVGLETLNRIHTVPVYSMYSHI